MFISLSHFACERANDKLSQLTAKKTNKRDSHVVHSYMVECPSCMDYVEFDLGVKSLNDITLAQLGKTSVHSDMYVQTIVEGFVWENKVQKKIIEFIHVIIRILKISFKFNYL